MALLVMWLGLLFFGGWAALQTRETMLNGRQAAVQNIVEAGVGVVAQYQQMAERHEMSVEEAKRGAMARLSAMRFPGNGYLFITDGRPVVIMHPILADLVNQDMTNYKDANGKLLFMEMIKVSREHGQGFVDYMARVPGKNEQVPKISFVKRFEPWDWYIASGVYVNDIDAAFHVRLINYLLTILVLGALSTVALVMIIRNVQRSLGGEPAYAAALAESIAGGDLTQDVIVRDGDRGSMVLAMRQMQNRLAETMHRIRGGTETINDAAQQIAAGNLDLSSRTEEQAASLGETAASMEQLTATVKQNADNARQANQMAADTSRIAGEGGEAVQQVVSTMQNIAASSARVVDIISVIEGIAFQTNILALNAAVEAARAGEQGRGFAVVAGEVRNLARRSSEAAKEIKGLIEESVGSVEAGKTLVESAGSKMDSLVHSVKRVTDIISEISAASEEQSRGIEQVNIAIAQMDQTTQQNAAMVEQAAGSAQAMQEQARLLADVVSTFRTRRVAH
ncbi:methyl-accepting chemotaxis protein [Trinickia diaoshuihuensis]|jgi:methyl-accepting chemotaxis protein|uniref:methyl-accepting chemotaxis protein n=1 Tax=Trinickia diaoshuihuensis TaxID=2292265 RepID=UPI000E26A291|nr:methyl-accepting chemotaxis protein [Trinickia diaoshuihuensis]